MIRNKLLILILGVAVFAIGCGGNTTTSTNTNTNANTNIAANPANAVVQNSEAAAANSNANSNTQVVIPKPVTGSKPQPMTQPAPDNSEVSTFLGDDLLQTRVFKKHAQLSKVEQTTSFVDGKEKKTIKVFLKNGQVKEIGEGKIKDAMTESADAILKAIN